MLSVYDLSKREEWDKIVRSFQKYDVYYLSGYTKAFQINGDGEPLLFYYQDEKCRGINVVMKRDIADDSRFKDKIKKNMYFDLVTPYGYGGWLIEGELENIEKLMEQYGKWCRKHNVVSEFVRFHPMLKNKEDVKEFYQVIDLGNTVAMDLESPEVIWSNLITQNRNKIRKAEKNGLKIYHSQNPEIYKIFREIYNETMDRDNAEDYYYFSDEFYESVLNDLKYQGTVFYAQTDEGEIVAASIIIGANGLLNYHLSGSKGEYRNLAPSNLMLYEIALWGSANGYRSFHMGGGVGSKEDNLYVFKKGFYRGEPKQFSIGKKIFNENSYKMLTEMRDNIQNPSFFPEYRG